MERIPILKMGDCLLVTIQVDMHDRVAMTLQDDLTNRIVETGAKGVLIDISSREIVDSVRCDLARDGIETAERVPLGVMIETPASVFGIDLLAPRS